MKMMEDEQIYGRVALPRSKSISNRLLLIRTLMGEECPMEQLADSDDTCILYQALQGGGCSLNIGHAGTAMRFLTAFLAQKKGVWELSGSERMKQRPIGGLVEALIALGAQIEYMEHPGYPPLRIEGRELEGGELEISASVSSQYISALLLIAPYMKRGLKLHLQGKIVSDSYINMTLQMMQTFGAVVNRQENRIQVAYRPYQSIDFQVEADWSAASYFFSRIAVARCGELRLTGLHAASIQGDARQMELWKKLGVESHFVGEELLLTYKPVELSFFEIDFKDMPDLIPTFAVACCLLETPFRFRGIETLHIKETDRVAALVTELKKIGYLVSVENAGEEEELCWNGEKQTPELAPCIQTYQDHRMAMAFAVAILKFPQLQIENREVVSKSFPGFWEEWEKVIKH